MTGNQLRKLRLQLGLTQVGLMSALGYSSPATVSSQERKGTGQITERFATAMANLSSGERKRRE